MAASDNANNGLQLIVRNLLTEREYPHYKACDPSIFKMFMNIAKVMLSRVISHNCYRKMTVIFKSQENKTKS